VPLISNNGPSLNNNINQTTCTSHRLILILIHQQPKHVYDELDTHTHTHARILNQLHVLHFVNKITVSVKEDIQELTNISHNWIRAVFNTEECYLQN